MRTVKRVPRPFGLTSMVIEYTSKGSEELGQKIKSYVAQQWLLNGGQLFGANQNINQIAYILSCNPSEIHNQMANQMLTSNLWDAERANEILNSVISTSLAWNLEDRMQIENQLGILIKSQGNKYTPFVSAEVTKMLNLKINSSGSLQNLLSKLSGGNTVNIFTQPTTIEETHNITVEGAVDIIQGELKKDNFNTLKYLEETIDFEELPEVNATKQRGIDVSKEGLNINKKEIAKSIDDYKGALKESDGAHHEIRREIMERIDLEADDPELENY